MLLKMVRRFISDNFIFNMKIRNRLLLFFVIVVILPVSIILTAVYNRSIGIISKRIDYSLENSLNMVEINFKQKFAVAYDISTFIYLNPDLIKILSLSEHPSDKVALIEEMATLDKILESYEASETSEVSISPHIYMVNRPEYLQYNFSDKVTDISSIETEKWYLNIPAFKKYTVVGLIQEDSLQYIRLARKLYGLSNPDIPYSALLTIDIDVKNFINILNKYKPSTDSRVFIVDSSSSIVVGSEGETLGENFYGINGIKTDFGELQNVYTSFVRQINGVKTLIACRKIDSFGWTAIALCPLSSMYGELISFKNIMFAVLAVCVVLTVFLAVIFSENLSYPIRKLVDSMHMVKSGNFDINIEYKRNDEFSYLIDTYKEMLKEIKGLIAKLYETESNKREAELKALQAQINPHFLYNTLDSINWLALKYKADDISTMVTSLSDFFRYSLSKGKNIITLGDEKKQVESYLAIQKIRFAEKLDYNICFPGDLLDYLTVKLILQPIVENSIVHGIEKKRGRGFISISAQKIDINIEITISDNGIGADIDEMNAILGEKSGSGRSFGIRNVNERIRQLFGIRYGIRFLPGEETGVTAVVRIPAIKTLEGFDVKDGNSR